MADKGLRDIVAAETKVSDIDGALGRLWYAGYAIEDLAEHSTYPEVSYLLHHTRLPTRAELDELTGFFTIAREPSRFLIDLMPTLAQQTSPMSMLRTSVSAASAYDPDGWDESAEAQLRKALRLIAKTPTFIAMYHRLRTGQEVVPRTRSSRTPRTSCGCSSAWSPRRRTPRLDTTFTLYADHTMNASTFTARIIASTLADMFSAITGAIAALKGPLHGGANEEAMKMLEEIGDPSNAEAYVQDRLARHEKIMGFGHAVYTTMDPRARVLKALADVGERHGEARWVEISEEIEKVTVEEKGLYPNVDFYAASVYHALGIPTDLMTPIFAVARMAGWTAHVREQYADNKVIRPGSEYVGPRDQTWVPVDQRS